MSECKPLNTLSYQIADAETAWKHAKRQAELTPGEDEKRSEFAAFALLQILYEADALLRDALYDWDNTNG